MIKIRQSSVWKPSFHTGFAQYKGGSIYPILWDDLVLNFDSTIGIQGNTPRDFSLYQRGMTCQNMVATDWAVTSRGYSLNFGGTNQFILISDSPSLSFGNATKDDSFSISAWVYMRDATDFKIISKRDANGNQKREWLFQSDSSDNLAVTLFDEDNANRIGVVSTSTLTSLENKWIHVAFTYDASGSSSGLRLFLNGVRLSTTTNDNGTYVAMHDTNKDVAIGTNSFSGGGNFANGYISNILVYKQRLSVNRIKQLARGDTPLYPSSLSRLISTTSGTTHEVSSTLLSRLQVTSSASVSAIQDVSANILSRSQITTSTSTINGVSVDLKSRLQLTNTLSEVLDVATQFRIKSGLIAYTAPPVLVRRLSLNSRIHKPSFHSGYAISRGQCLRPVFWDNLIGMWATSLGIQGTELFDVSNRAHDGAFSNMNATQWSVLSNGYVLDYITNRAVVIGSALGKPAKWTISAWIQPRTFSTNAIVRSTFAAITTDTWGIHGASGSGIRVTVSSSNGGSSQSLTAESWNSTNYPTNKMTHIVGTVDGNTISFYRNGTLISSVAQTVAMGGAGRDLAIGRDGEATSLFFDGYIGDVAIWDRALNPLEVKLLALGITPLSLKRFKYAFIPLEVIDTTTAISSLLLSRFGNLSDGIGTFDGKIKYFLPFQTENQANLIVDSLSDVLTPIILDSIPSVTLDVEQKVLSRSQLGGQNNLIAGANSKILSRFIKNDTINLIADSQTSLLSRFLSEVIANTVVDASSNFLIRIIQSNNSQLLMDSEVSLLGKSLMDSSSIAILAVDSSLLSRTQQQILSNIIGNAQISLSQRFVLDSNYNAILSLSNEILAQTFQQVLPSIIADTLIDMDATFVCDPRFGLSLPISSSILNSYITETETDLFSIVQAYLNSRFGQTLSSNSLVDSITTLGLSSLQYTLPSIVVDTATQLQHNFTVVANSGIIIDSLCNLLMRNVLDASTIRVKAAQGTILCQFNQTVVPSIVSDVQIAKQFKHILTAIAVTEESTSRGVLLSELRMVASAIVRSSTVIKIITRDGQVANLINLDGKTLGSIEIDGNIASSIQIDFS